MNPLVFSDPDKFMEFFESADKFYIMPSETLVIKKIEGILDEGVWNRDIPDMLRIDQGLYFLNRILLPLGKCLEKDETDVTPFDLEIDDNKARLSKRTVTRLHLKNGPIVTNIKDFFIRMLQSGKLTVSLVPGQALQLVMPEAHFNQDINAAIPMIYKYYAPGGLHVNFDFSGPMNGRKIKDHVFLELNPIKKFGYQLSHTYEYSNPDILGRMMVLQNGFTVPAGKTLKISEIKNRAFYSLFEQSNFSRGLHLLLNQCLVLHGREIKSFSEGSIRWSFDGSIRGGTFEAICVESLKVTHQESNELYFELKSFASQLNQRDGPQKRLIMTPGRNYIFLLSNDENQVLEPIFQKSTSEDSHHELAQSIVNKMFGFPTTLIGLRWECSWSEIRLVKGVDRFLGMPQITLEGKGTIALVPEVGAKLIADIITTSSQEIQEAFLQQDILVFRYLLTRTIFEILAGSLYGYSMEDLSSLCLKPDVMKKMDQIRKDGDFNLAYRTLIYQHDDEVLGILRLNHTALDMISVESYSPSVQKFLRAVIELSGMELQGSVYLTRHYPAALDYIKKKSQKNSNE